MAGFVEEPSFYPYLSGRANLELLAELDGGADRARVAEALAAVGLTKRSEERLSGYSSGMRQRLGIAACVLRRPRLLLLDEPTAGLDPPAVRQVGALVRELAAGGATVLLSSHQIEEVEDVCDGFTVLAEGRVVWDGTAAQLRAQAPASAHALATSDDETALEIAAGERGIDARIAPGGGFVIAAEQESLDRYMVALGRARVAVRRLELLTSPLESMFFALTGETAPAAELPVAQAAHGRGARSTA
jgi:ABC-2 type transport system ATP-binding protein